MLLQVAAKVVLAAPVGSATRQIANDQAGRIVGIGFKILGIATGIADMRIGQRDDLAAIRGVGQNFLIARHRRVENHFAAGDAIGAYGLALEYRPIGEGEDGGCV